MQNKVLCINRQIQSSICFVSSIEEMKTTLEHPLSEGMLFIPSIGVINYVYSLNSSSTSPKKITTAIQLHTLLRAVNFPCFFYMKDTFGKLVDMRPSVLFTLMNYLSLTPMNKDLSIFQNTSNTFVGNKFEVTKCDATKLTVVHNTFLGNEGSVIGTADMVVVEGVNSRIVNGRASENGKCVNNVLDSFQIVSDKQTYLDRIYDIENNEANENKYLWGRVLVIKALSIFPIYSKELLITCMLELINDAIEQLKVDCLVINYEDIQMYLDYQSDLPGELIQASKEHILKSIGFWDVTDSPFNVFYNLSSIEKEHLNSKIKPLIMLHSLYGTYDDYILEGKSETRRLFIKYNNINNDVFTVAQALHLAAYHNDLETIQLLSNKMPFYYHDILGYDAIQLAVITDSLDVFTYFVENGFIAIDEKVLSELAHLMIQFNATQCLEFLLNDYCDYLPPIVFLLKQALETEQKDCIALLLKQGEDSDNGYVRLYAEIIDTPTDIKNMIE